MNLFENVRKYEITVIGNVGSDQPYHPTVAGEAFGNTAIEQIQRALFVIRIVRTAVILDQTFKQR